MTDDKEAFAWLRAKPACVTHAVRKDPESPVGDSVHEASCHIQEFWQKYLES